MYVKALTEYDENKTKTQEIIKKKKADPDAILSCEKELDRLSDVTEGLKASLEVRLDALTTKRCSLYSKCILQLMDRFVSPSFATSLHSLFSHYGVVTLLPYGFMEIGESDNSRI